MKKMISLVMVLTMLLCMVPTTTMATSYGRIIIGNWSYGIKDGYWTLFDEQGENELASTTNGVLYFDSLGKGSTDTSLTGYIEAITLNSGELNIIMDNASLTDTIIVDCATATVILEGSNSISLSNLNSSGTFPSGIFLDGDYLGIEGDGNLAISMSSNNCTMGFGIFSTNSIHIFDCPKITISLMASCTTKKEIIFGGIVSFLGDIVVNNSVLDVEANSNLDNDNGVACLAGGLIALMGDISISNSTFTSILAETSMSCVTGTNMGIGFGTYEGNISIENTTIEKIQDTTDGIVTKSGNIRFINSTVNIFDEGVSNAPDCVFNFLCAIHAEGSTTDIGNVLIQDSQVVASSTNAYGIYASNKLTVSGTSYVKACTSNQNNAIEASQTDIATNQIVGGKDANSATAINANGVTGYKYVVIGSNATGYGGYGYYPSTKTVKSASTWDAGALLYAGMAISSLLGTGYVVSKKKKD